MVSLALLSLSFFKTNRSQSKAKMQWSEHVYDEKDPQSQGSFQTAWLPCVPTTPADKLVLEVRACRQPESSR